MAFSFKEEFCVRVFAYSTAVTPFLQHEFGNWIDSGATAVGEAYTYRVKAVTHDTAVMV